MTGHLRLGCIADDFTGGTDLASVLVAQGMRTVQTVGVPASSLAPGDTQAVVVALKSRTVPAAEAVADSLAALEWLRVRGARQIFFKYCSTFDSTDEGNIGPVTEALLDALGGEFTIACPAYPANGRSVYNGHLFVGRELLERSPMRNHPLTPMADSNLVSVLQRQTSLPVGLVAHDAVSGGAREIAAQFNRLRADGVRIAIVDAVEDQALRAIGLACADLALVTGGAGVALGLPANFAVSPSAAPSKAFRAPEGAAAIVAGSCSAATRAQIAAIEHTFECHLVDPLAHESADACAAAALDWAEARIGEAPVVIYSSANPQVVSRVQDKLGRGPAGAWVERALAAVALGLAERGVRRMVVAGGETSGAVVEALGATALEIGPEIAPGVPWTRSLGEPSLALALKSGNFGGEDFFSKAFEMIE